MSWFVNTNEDVGGFRLELRSSGIPQTTLFSKNLPYDQREENIRIPPAISGQDWTMCILVENSAGRLRRWKQENCRKASLISKAARPAAAELTLLLASLLVLLGTLNPNQFITL